MDSAENEGGGCVRIKEKARWSWRATKGSGGREQRTKVGEIPLGRDKGAKGEGGERLKGEGAEEETEEEDRAACRGPGDIRGLIEFTSSPAGVGRTGRFPGQIQSRYTAISAPALSSDISSIPWR